MGKRESCKRGKEKSKRGWPRKAPLPAKDEPANNANPREWETEKKRESRITRISTEVFLFAVLTTSIRGIRVIRGSNL